MGIWLQLGLAAAGIAISYLLRPKPKLEKQRAEQFTQENAPRAEEGIPVPIVYGTNRIEGLNLIDMMDLRAEPSLAMINGKFETVGYKYGGILAFGVCLSYGAVTFRKLWAADRKFWSGSVTPTSMGGSGATALTSQTLAGALWGGAGKGGGIERLTAGGSALIRFFAGYAAQNPNALMEGTIDEELPAYRGLSYFVLEGSLGLPQRGGVGLGESVALPPISAEVQVIPNALGLGAIGLEANPAEVLYDLLTNEWAGIGIDPSFIDSASFIAAGETLDDEDHGISLVISQPGTAGESVREVERQIDGLLWEDHSAGTIKLRLIRDDYNPIDLLELNGDDVVIEEFRTQTWEELYSQVIVNYRSRARGYKPASQPGQDQAQFFNSDRGAPRTAEVSFPGCCTEALANQLAGRVQNSLSIPDMQIRLRANRKAVELRPGDVFVLDYPEYDLENVVLRVMKYDLGSLGKGEIVLECARDKFDTGGGAPFSLPGSPPEDSVVAPDDVPPQPIEAPRWLVAKAVYNGTTATDLGSSYLMHLGRTGPGTANVNFTPEASADGTTYNSDRYQPAQFTPAGTLDTDYPRLTDLYDTSVGIVVELEDDTDLDTATEDEIRDEGKNLIMVGDEIMAYESYTDNMDGTFTLENVWRGLLDTIPADHFEDDTVWLLAGSTGIDFQPIGDNRFTGDETLQVRFVPSTGVRGFDPDSATTAELQLQHRALAGHPVANFEILDSRDPGLIAEENPQMTGDRRRRLDATIVRQDDGDQGDPDSAGADTEADSDTTYYRWHLHDYETVPLVLRLLPGTIPSSLAGGGNTLDGQDSDNTSNPRRARYLSWGPVDFGITTHRLDVDPLKPGSTLLEIISYAYQAATLPIEFASYRQLLVNPGFEYPSGGDGSGWEPGAGTSLTDATWETGSTALGGQGVAFAGSATDDPMEISQDIANDICRRGFLDVTGQSARLEGYAINYNTDADDDLELHVEALDSMGSVITSETLDINSPATTEWGRYVCQLDDVPYGTETLRVRVISDGVGDSAPDSGGDAFDFRVGIFTDSGLSNTGFEAGATTGWTEDAGTWRVVGTTGGTIPLGGVFMLAGPAMLAGTAIIHQDDALPGDIGEGDVAWLSWWQANIASSEPGRVRLQALDSMAAVIEESDTGAFNETANDVWFKHNLYLTLPAGTTDVRVQVETSGGPAAHDTAFDDFQLVYINKRVRHATMDLRDLTTEDLESNRFANWLQIDAHPFGCWRFDQDSGDADGCTTTGEDLAPANTPTQGTFVPRDLDSRVVEFSANSSERMVAPNTSFLDAGATDSIALFYDGIIDALPAMGERWLVSKINAGAGFGILVNSSGDLIFRVTDGMATDDATAADAVVGGDHVRCLGRFNRTSTEMQLHTLNHGESAVETITAGSPSNAVAFSVGASAAASSAADAKCAEVAAWVGEGAEGGEELDDESFGHLCDRMAALPV